VDHYGSDGNCHCGGIQRNFRIRHRYQLRYGFVSKSTHGMMGEAPEPASWITMLAGLGLILIGVRKHTAPGLSRFTPLLPVVNRAGLLRLA